MPPAAAPLTPIETAGLAGFWILVLLAIAAARQLAPARARSRLILPGAEPIRIHTADGLWLAAWQTADFPAAPWILAYPGIDHAVDDVQPLLERLRQAGFNLLLLLPRAYRPSQGSATSLGGREQRDIEAALAHLSRLPDVSESVIGVLAISTGALAAFLVAARDERLGLLVLESLAGDPVTALADRLGRACRLPRAAAWPLAWLMYRVRFGRPVGGAQIRAAASAISNRPVLLIRGSADRRLSARRLRDITASAGAQVSEVGGADHRTMPRTSPEYVQHVTEFFRTYLQPSPSRTAARVPSSI